MSPRSIYTMQDLPTGHHLRLLSLQKPPEETSWKVLVYLFIFIYPSHHPPSKHSPHPPSSSPIEGSKWIKGKVPGSSNPCPRWTTLHYYLRSPDWTPKQDGPESSQRIRVKNKQPSSSVPTKWDMPCQDYQKPATSSFHLSPRRRTRGLGAIGGDVEGHRDVHEPRQLGAARRRGDGDGPRNVVDLKSTRCQLLT